ncbi:MAG: YbjQ family protein [Gemmatimonadaceae bacterium]|nr:YbjQ family protein [Gemmatimonadaceae bacterium]
MYVTTTLSFEGYRIKEYKGVVRGIVVRAPTIAQGFMGNLKSMVGGRIGAFTEMCEQAREEAFDLLVQHAGERGANAIIGVRYDASDIGGHTQHATEVLCYGTAVVIEPAG